MNLNLSGLGAFTGEACSLRKAGGHGVGQGRARTQHGPTSWPHGQVPLCRTLQKVPHTVIP